MFEGSMTVGSLSYLAALLAYLLLAILLLTSWRGRLMGLFAVGAVVGTIAWAGVGLIVAAGLPIPAAVISLVELVRNAGWFLFLTSILLTEHDDSGRRFWSTATGLTIVLSGSLTLLVPSVLATIGLKQTLNLDALLLGGIAQAVFGLLLIEQVFRNRLPSRRWEIKHLCFGLGAVFAYDLFFYSDALLMRRFDAPLWEARGIVNALIVPLIAVSAARNPSWSLNVHVSRHVVFHSATLTGAGLYLMSMAAAGYYIRYFGGVWSTVLQIAFLFSAGLFLILLLSSGQLRARLRVLVSRHFFSLKYDYREEWLRFTEALSKNGDNLPTAVVSALGEIVNTTAGMLWARHEAGGFELLERIHLPAPRTLSLRGDDALAGFLIRSGWVINLDEWRLSPDLYQDLEIPEWLREFSSAWLIVPLINREELCGFVILGHPRAPQTINWEDRALLKTAGRQAASHVARYLSDQALMRARQFEAFNQLSAYVAHDLKNLLAQQSLILSNAEKHRHNPAFIEDVMETIKSSVERMNRLMTQLRDGVRGGERTCIDLDGLIQETIKRYADRAPIPQVEILAQGLRLMSDRERLRTVLGHLIQNAREATGPEGSVVVRSLRDGQSVMVEIEDNGVGMSAEFIRDRLFRPFDSTKGLTGMGIGAFEAREMVRLLGGDLTVQSRPGQGSLFRIALPGLGIPGPSDRSRHPPSQAAA